VGEFSDRGLLKSISNPSTNAYEIVHHTPEVTFLGVRGQPDFADVTIRLIPNGQVIELKSLKQYLVDLRNRVFSYERLVNVLYDDLRTVYEPRRLHLEVRTRPRGGIESTLTIDSDDERE